MDKFNGKLWQHNFCHIAENKLKNVLSRVDSFGYRRFNRISTFEKKDALLNLDKSFKYFGSRVTLNFFHKYFMVAFGETFGLLWTHIETQAVTDFNQVIFFRIIDIGFIGIVICINYQVLNLQKNRITVNTEGYCLY